MEGFAFVDERTVTWRDLDAMGHVNNAVYLTYCETARIRYLQHVLDRTIFELPLVVVKAEINYRAAATLADRLLVGVRTAETGRTSFVVEHRIEQQEDGTLVADNVSTIVHLDDKGTESAPVPEWLRTAFVRFERGDA